MMRRPSVRFQIALLVWLAIVASTAVCGRFATRMTEAATWDLLWQQSQSVGNQQVLAWQQAKEKTAEGFVASYRPAKYPDGSAWDHASDPALWIWEVPSDATSVDMVNPGRVVWSVGENPLVTSGQGAGKISEDPSVFPKEATPALWPIGLSSLKHDFAGSSTLPMANGKTLLVVEAIDTTDARFRVDYQQRETLRLGILISLVGAAVAWVLAGLVSGPIERLGRTVRAFGKGDGSARASASGPAEVARLGQDFNAMADRVQATLTAQRRFVADTSHELRTPTAALLASSSALDLSGPHDEVLDLMVPQVERLAGLTEDLLALNRFDEGAQRVDAHKVEVFGLARHAVDEVAAGRDVRVQGEEFTATLDPHRVRLVVRNLVANALQHGAEPVAVAVSPQDAGARIEVRDAGAGVPDELRDVVFDRFVRGDGARHEGGRGLGLSLARETCRLHGGDLELGGDGSFVATLTEPSTAPAQVSSPATAGRTLNRVRAVVDEALPLAALQGLMLTLSSVAISGRLYFANDSQLFSRATWQWLPLFLLGWLAASAGAVACGRLGRRVDRTLGVVLTLAPIGGLWWWAHRAGEFPVSDALLVGTGAWLVCRLVKVARGALFRSR